MGNVATPRSPALLTDAEAQWRMQDVSLYLLLKFALVEEISNVKVEAFCGHDTCLRNKVNLVHLRKSWIILLPGGESQIWKGVWHLGLRGASVGVATYTRH